MFIKDKKRENEKWISAKSFSGAGAQYLNLIRICNDVFGLVTVDPVYLNWLHDLFRIFESVLLRPRGKRRSENDKKLKRAKAAIGKLFDYEKFSGGYQLKIVEDNVFQWTKTGKHWSAWHYLKSLNVSACSYCNSDGVFSLVLFSSDKTSVETLKRSPFDHFFSKSKYPFLSLTLANLIPACSRCNTNFKGAAEFDSSYIYPYQESFSDGVNFYTVFKNSETLLRPTNLGLDILVAPKFSGEPTIVNRALRSAEFFHLSEVYNQLYKDFAVDLTRKSILMPNEYVQDLKRRIPWLLDSEVKRLLLGCECEFNDFNRRPLSKLALDIQHQLRVDQ